MSKRVYQPKKGKRTQRERIGPGYDAAAYWEGAMGAASSVLQMVVKRYNKNRFHILWMRDQRPCEYCYPFPYAVEKKNWQASIVNGQPTLTISFPSGVRGKPDNVVIVLRNGPEFARQLADFRRLVSGKAAKHQLLITRQRASDGCHRRTTSEKEPGGGNRVSYRIMVKMIVAVDVPKKTSDRVLTLITDPQALWVAELDGRRAWVLNADHIRRAVEWQQTHAARRQRWAEDCKAERRCSPRKRRQFQESRDRCCSKHERRMHSWCQEAAAHLANFCVRQHVDHVLYRDIGTSWLPGVPRHKLNAALANALAQKGIALDCHSDAEDVEEVCEVG